MREREFDPDEIQIGDLVDFGPYGQLYVVKDYGDRLWVTDLEKDRYNPDARGWGIRKSYADGIIEKRGEDEEYEGEDQLSFEQIYNIVSNSNAEHEQQAMHFIELAKEVGYDDYDILGELVREFGMKEEEAQEMIDAYGI
jgi:hypothetical protein